MSTNRLVAILLFASVAEVPAVAELAAMTRADKSIVLTERGPVRGTVTGSVRRFLGTPHLIGPPVKAQMPHVRRCLQAALLALVALVGNACGGSANVDSPTPLDPKYYFRTLNSRLFGKIHAAHQVLEAWVGAQTIESGVNLQQNHPFGAPFVRNLEPTESFVVLA